MGMFDWVNYECQCPRCGNKVDGFRSKCGECLLDTVEPDDVDNFYTSCGVCGAWIEFNRNTEPHEKFIMMEISKDRTKTHR